MKHYRHQSLYYKMVIMTLQPIEFVGAEINYPFYVRRIAVWKLQFLRVGSHKTLISCANILSKCMK
jgi:hypothetical protein